MSAGQSRIEVEKFGGKGFELWKLKMEALLVDRDLWYVIEDEKPELPTKDKAKEEEIASASAQMKTWISSDRKARSLIWLCLADNVLVNVTSEKTAKDLWTKLGSLYQSKSLVNKLFLRKRLYNLRMSEGDSFSAHLNEFNTVCGQLASIDVNLDEEDKACTLLCSLPNSWEHIIISIGTGVSTLSFENVVSALLSEEMRRAGSDNAANEALFVRGRGGERFKPRFGARNKSRGRSKSRDRSEIKCWKCGKAGHLKKDCRNRSVGPEKRDEAPSSSVKKDDDSNVGDMYLVCNSSQVDRDAWIIDTGASFHMTPHRDWFCCYEPYQGGSVRMGDDSTLDIVGHGKVKLKMKDGTVKNLPDVMHIPGLTRNLISVGTMADAGITFTSDKYSCKLTRGSVVIARGEREGKLWKLLGNTMIRGESYITEHVEEESAMLWHRRLGHIGEKGLMNLTSKNMVDGIPSCSMGFGFCEHCLHGKQNRVSFESMGGRAKGILELIHSDVFGPTPVASFGKSRYYVSFTDDFSRHVWIYFLQRKDDVFDKFREFKALVENQFDRKIKVLRTDNGGEFCSTKFNQFCATSGIARQKTTPYSPQQNGVAERLNRSLMEKARSMLSDANLAAEFWAEAVATACYLKNRSPTSILKDQTPFEALFGKKPDVSHVRVFGCEAYVHVPKEKRNKLESKSEKCIFIGYKEGVKGYKLWNPDTKHIVYSRDVVFRESTQNQIVSQSPEEPHSVELDVGLHGETEATQAETENSSSEADEPDMEDDLVDSDTEIEVEVPSEPVLRRSTRVIKPPERYTLFANNESCALTVTGDDPITIKEARSAGDAKQWEIAMKDEMDSLDKNRTWSLVKLPANRKAIGCKWIFKKKISADGDIERYKARLVAKGYSQIEGVDYGEIFSPVAKLSSIRLVLSAAAAYNLEVEQLDVKTAFLHGDLEEDIYMKQPDGFVVKGKEDFVCKLSKSLYGLKQSPRMWYQKFDSYVLKLGFVRCDADHCVYVKRLDDDFIILTLYVDDMLLVGNSMKMINAVKGLLAKQFEMKDLGPANFILGMQIKRERENRKLWLSQKNYIESVLKKFNMTDCKPVKTPMSTSSKLSALQCPKTKEESEEMATIPYASAVGSLMYAMVCTRPDIAQAVGVLSRYMSNPGKEHWIAAKRVFRYLRGTSDIKLCYEGVKSSNRQQTLELKCFVDADWGGDIDSRRSTSGYVISSFGGAVTWMSKRQSTVALSSTEAEYMALTHAAKEVIWMSRLCKELGFTKGEVNVGCDSQSAIFLAKNPTFHARTKHIDIQYHFIREKVEQKDVVLEKVDTKVNSADFLTKAVTVEKFEWCTTELGLKKHEKYSPSGRMLGCGSYSPATGNHVGPAPR